MDVGFKAHLTQSRQNFEFIKPFIDNCQILGKTDCTQRGGGFCHLGEVSAGTTLDVWRNA